MLRCFLSLCQYTHASDYLVLVKDVLQDIDADELVLMLVERHMALVHQVF